MYKNPAKNRDTLSQIRKRISSLGKKIRHEQRITDLLRKEQDLRDQLAVEKSKVR